MKTETNFETMGKVELRAACKEHGVKYGKLDNAGMRLALIAATESAVQEETATVAETEVAATDVEPVRNVFGSMFAPVVIPTAKTPSRMVIDGKVHTGALPPVQQHAKREAVIIPPAPVRPVLPKGGYKVEKVRETRNGKTRPSVGTICAALWDMFDTNPEIRAKNLFTLADANGWDRTTTHVQFYAWRKFKGIKGRQS
jgi:hypothetical protein